MTQQAIIIIGGGILSCYAIRRAKELGFMAICTDRDPVRRRVHQRAGTAWQGHRLRDQTARQRRPVHHRVGVHRTAIGNAGHHHGRHSILATGLAAVAGGHVAAAEGKEGIRVQRREGICLKPIHWS